MCTSFMCVSLSERKCNYGSKEERIVFPCNVAIIEHYSGADDDDDGDGDDDDQSLLCVPVHLSIHSSWQYREPGTGCPHRT